MLPKSDQLTVMELFAAFKRHARTYYGPQAREFATYCTLTKQLGTKFGDTLIGDVALGALHTIKGDGRS